MRLDELTRLTQRTAAIVERLTRIARHSQADADGLVITTQMTVLEHDLETLIDVVQLRAIKEHVTGLPHRAPYLKQPRLSSDLAPHAEVDQFTVQGLPQSEVSDSRFDAQQAYSRGRRGYTGPRRLGGSSASATVLNVRQ